MFPPPTWESRYRLDRGLGGDDCRAIQVYAFRQGARDTIFSRHRASNSRTISGFVQHRSPHVHGPGALRPRPSSMPKLRFNPPSRDQARQRPALRAARLRGLRRLRQVPAGSLEPGAGPRLRDALRQAQGRVDGQVVPGSKGSQLSRVGSQDHSGKPRHSSTSCPGGHASRVTWSTAIRDDQ